MQIICSSVLWIHVVFLGGGRGEKTGGGPGAGHGTGSWREVRSKPRRPRLSARTINTTQAPGNRETGGALHFLGTASPGRQAGPGTSPLDNCTGAQRAGSGRASTPCHVRAVAEHSHLRPACRAREGLVTPASATDACCFGKPGHVRKTGSPSR